MTTFPAETRNEELMWKCLLFVVVALGIFARLSALGSAPLIDDEYYFARSIDNLIQFGFPAYETGGYYTRGLIQQYLTAPLIMMGMERELALRLFPAIAGILALPAVYMLGHRMGGIKVAVIATALISLSLWEIEFSRFIRMYSPFQTVFLWYLVFFTSAIVDKNPRSFAMMWLVSLLGIFVYAASTFLLLFNFVPLLMNQAFRVKALLIPLGILVFSQLVKLPQDGDLPKHPADLAASVPAHANGVVPSLPKILLTEMISQPIWLIGFVLLAAFAARVIYSFVRSENEFLMSKIMFLVALVSALLGVFGAAVACLAAGLILETSYSKRATDTCIDILKRVAPFAICCGVFWLAFCLVETEWRSELNGGLDASRLGNVFVQTAAVLFNYPESLTRFVKPLFDATPITSLIYFALAGVAFIAYLTASEIRNRHFALVCLVFIGCVTLVSIAGAFFKTTRYIYFLYPVLVLLAACGIAALTRRLPFATAAAFTALAAVVFIAEDFNLKHIFNIDDPKYMYRTVYSEGQGSQLLPRRDLKAPILYVNERMDRSNELVITDVTIADYYLEKQLDYMYLSKELKKFWERAVNHGTVDRWSTAPLLYEQKTLEKTIREAGQPVWFIAAAVDWKGTTDSTFRDVYGEYLVHTNSDSTIDVFYITP